MNKKAMLDETMKLILAVLVLVLLGFGVIKVYQVALGDTELKSAQNILNQIAAKSKALNIGQNTTMTLVGFDSDEKWIIAGWNKSDALAPNKCFASSCVCVCSTLEQKLENIAKDCNNRGICEDIKTDKMYVLGRDVPILEDDLPVSIFDKTTKEFQYISIGPSFSELQFQKTTESNQTVLIIKNE